MQEFENTPEFRAEVMKQKEERRKRNEPLNKAALEKMKVSLIFICFCSYPENHSGSVFDRKRQEGCQVAATSHRKL